jgi:sporulation protein YlmC with PRC-barrel domain
MLKTFITATAIGGLMLSSAMAQTTTPSAPASPPAAMPAPAAAGAPSFIAAQKSDQWLASKFSGTDVLGPNNEKIGDVNDVLFDKSGKIMAVIVGVGGFLGIGQKDVALDMAAFQVVPASTSDSANTGSSTAASSSDPNNVKLKVSMTKEQLSQAPSFERYKAAARTTGTGGSAPMGSGTQRP